MKYFVMRKSASAPYSELYDITGIKKNSLGKYTVSKFNKTYSKSMVARSINLYSDSNMKKWAEAGTCPVDPSLARKQSKFICAQTYTSSISGFKSFTDITGKKIAAYVLGEQTSKAELKNEINAMKNYMNNTFDNIDRQTISYLYHRESDNTLWLYTHKKGNWRLTRRDVIRQTVNGKVTQVKVVTNVIAFDSKGNVTSDTINNIYNTYQKNYLHYTNYSRSTLYYDCELLFTGEKIGNANDWEIGSWEGSHSNVVGAAQEQKQYCFYCKKVDKDTQSGSLSYLIKDSSKGLPIVQSKNKNKLHDQSTHGIKYTGVANDSSSGSVSTATKDFKYGVVGDSSKASKVDPVTKLSYGTVGEYQDGVAPTPIVMIELRGKDDDNFPPYNVSIPANSFVSLTHDRNLHDSYNTFSLQLFDKDAMQIESYLLLGYRYIQFYYTDFVATSKRFKGEILNYQTVITGKGLMLTLDGYTSNTNIYTGKDSIPWSYFFEVQDYAFLYWLNAAGEDHGLVRVSSKAESGISRPEFLAGGFKDANTVYNNEEGFALPARLLYDQYPNIYSYVTGQANPNIVGPVKDNKLYQLKNSSGEWITYDQYTEDVDSSVREKYRPLAREFSLTAYNGNIANDLACRPNIFSEMRPSNVVVLICVLKGWKYDPKDIVVTEKVATIPNQISKSFLQYIKEDLIPISVSTGGATNYDFWFDDKGMVHFAPGTSTSSGKSLYFNSTARKDSYPLISFTAATNGAVLMQTDATQVMESINIYTGDEQDFSAVKTDKLQTSIHKSEEWYATNAIVNKDSDSRLVVYSGSSGIKDKNQLKAELVNRYGMVARYSYKAELSVYGCSDLEPGTSVDVYIYIGDGKRSNDKISVKNSDGTYTGNITIHHSSGRYFIYQIQDNISAGRYISNIKALKVDEGQLSLTVGDGSEKTEYDMLDGGNSEIDNEGTVLSEVSVSEDIDVPVKAC